MLYICTTIYICTKSEVGEERDEFSPIRNRNKTSRKKHIRVFCFFLFLIGFIVFFLLYICTTIYICTKSEVGEERDEFSPIRNRNKTSRRKYVRVFFFLLFDWFYWVFFVFFYTYVQLFTYVQGSTSDFFWGGF